MASVCHVTSRYEHALFLHEYFVDFMRHFVCNGCKIKEHVCIKFCVKLGDSTTETLDMLHEAFGENSLSRTAIFEWHSCFKAGHRPVEDDKRSG
jgi:hypothetical protein